jgi:hypothetical protein
MSESQDWRTPRPQLLGPVLSEAFGGGAVDADFSGHDEKKRNAKTMRALDAAYGKPTDDGSSVPHSK